MAHTGTGYIPRKTDKDAEAVKNMLLEKAKELHELAQKTPGAQVIVAGGSGTASQLCAFQLGWATGLNKVMLLSNLLARLDFQEHMMLMKLLASNQPKGECEPDSSSWQ